MSRSPLLLFAIKSALAAGLAWEITSSLLGSEAAALAVVSSVIVVQVTSWQTIRRSIERILGVLIGISLALLIARFLGINIWTITLIVFFAQIIGLFFQNRHQYLATQIPISAALALLLETTASSYPLLRLLGALIGGLVGTIISLLLSPPIYVFRARDAIAALTTEFADALSRLAHALTFRQDETESRSIYTHIRELEQRVQATEQVLSLGIDNVHLNPWAHQASRLLIGYPDVMQTLEQIVRQIRRIAYTLNESEAIWSELPQKQEWPLEYARLLEEIRSILKSVAEYIRLPTKNRSSDLPNRTRLRVNMEHAKQQLRSMQAQLVQDAKQIDDQVEHNENALTSAGYHLAIRGSILTDLRRMLDEVQKVVMMTSSTPEQEKNKEKLEYKHTS